MGALWSLQWDWGKLFAVPVFPSPPPPPGTEIPHITTAYDPVLLNFHEVLGKLLFFSQCTYSE